MVVLKRVKFLLADGVVRAGGGRVGLPTGVLKDDAKGGYIHSEKTGQEWTVLTSDHVM